MTIAAHWPKLGMTLADIPREKGGRLTWADSAKGVSIILLVFWHTNQFHPALGVLRMPLFFFVSGLFAYHVITRGSFFEFMKDKIGNMIYVYVLWAMLLILATSTLPNDFATLTGDIKRWMQIFWNPPLTLWFIYGLAISIFAARLFYHLPFWAVLAGALAVHALCSPWTASPQPPFLARIGLLFPFFWIGLFVLPFAQDFVRRHHALWPLATSAFLAVAVLHHEGLLHFDLLPRFFVSCLGIAAILLFAKSAEETRLGTVLAYVGAGTLYIYLMHRIFLYYAHRVAEAWGVQSVPWDIGTVAVLVLGCAAAGRWLHGSKLGWLFTAPWAPARRKAAA